MPPLRISYSRNKAWEPVSLPGSKSIAARALICRYVGGLDTELLNMPDCDDTRELRRALGMLHDAVPDPRAVVAGLAEVTDRSLEFDLGKGGTSLRFFVALAASIPGLRCEITCHEMLRRRPLAPLLDALRDMGADIRCSGRQGYAPLIVNGRRLRGGEVAVDCTVSSQFLSALMMASPLWDTPAVFCQSGDVSHPYVEMTGRIMRQFEEMPERYVVESDWSAAAFFYELAMAVPGRALTIASPAMPRDSMQGDAVCGRIFDWLGVRTEYRADGSAVLTGDVKAIRIFKQSRSRVALDMKDAPDLVPALSAALCLSGISFDLGGLAHLKHKESDRLVSVCSELAKAGYAVSENDSGTGLTWNGRYYPVADDETYDAWGDHRIAMMLAVMAARKGWIAIEGAEAVSKSFPTFYRCLERVGFDVRYPRYGSGWNLG